MTEAELAAIEKRAEAATLGPWDTEIAVDPYAHTYPWLRVHDSEFVEVAGIINNDPSVERNLDFIAHARQDVPALVAEVRRLRAALLETAQFEMHGETPCWSADGACLWDPPASFHPDCVRWRALLGLGK
jgi:hypothetical protein